MNELTVAYQEKPTVVLEGTGGWSDRIREIAYRGAHLDESGSAMLHFAATPAEAVDTALALAADPTANVDHPLSVDEETLFQIGSITKTVTVTALMRLVEQGKVSLDVPVRGYSSLTLNELTVAYQDKPTVILEGTGGWADRMRQVAYDGVHLDEAGIATLHYAETPQEAVEMALSLATSDVRAKRSGEGEDTS